MRVGIKVDGAETQLIKDSLRLESRLGSRISTAQFDILGEKYFPWTEKTATKTITLRPNSFGDECNIDSQTGDACPNHWANIDEKVPDELTTRNLKASLDDLWQRDMYSLDDITIPTGYLIQSVTIYARCRIFSGAAARASLKVCMKWRGTIVEDAERTLTSSWADYIVSYADFGTLGSWRKSDIDQMQVGISLRNGLNPAGNNGIPMCTQMYVVIGLRHVFDAPLLSAMKRATIGGFTQPYGKDEVTIYRAPTPLTSIMTSRKRCALGGTSTYLNTFFGGSIATKSIVLVGSRRYYRCTAQDYNELPLRKLVTKSYAAQTEQQMLDDLFTTYLPDINTSTYVESSGVVATIDWTRVFLHLVLDELAAIYEKKWFIDFDKNLHWFTVAASAPFSLSSSPWGTTHIGYHSLEHVEDITGLINRAVVVGDPVGPIVQTRNDTDSQAQYGDIFEGKLVDANIDTAAWANLRGDAMLAESAFGKVIGRLTCQQEGLVIGQMVDIYNRLRNINDSYQVQSVNLSMLNGRTERVAIGYGDFDPNLTDILLEVKKLSETE